MGGRKFNFVDLFSGGGFGARGAVGAGGVPLVAVDAWDIAARTYKENFRDADVYNTAVEMLSPRAVVGKRQIDVLLTSPECTHHTHARGNRPRLESSRETALSSLVWAEEIKPRLIVMENVANMRSWARYGEMIEGLRSLGYGLTEKVLCSSAFGVPQRRRRLFVVAQRGDQPKQIAVPNRKVMAAHTILDPVGTWVESDLHAPHRAARTLRYAEAAISELGRKTPFLLVYYGSDKGGGWQSLDEPLRTVTTLDRFALVSPRRGGWTMRMLQPVELAKAMGLPRAHKFPFGTRRDKVKLCGNGICTPVMKHVIEGAIA